MLLAMHPTTQTSQPTGWDVMGPARAWRGPGLDRSAGPAAARGARRGPGSGHLDVAHLGQVEEALVLLPAAILLQAFDALGAAEDVAVLGESALAEKSMVNAH